MRNSNSSRIDSVIQRGKVIWSAIYVGTNPVGLEEHTRTFFRFFIGVDYLPALNNWDKNYLSTGVERDSRMATQLNWLRISKKSQYHCHKEERKLPPTPLKKTTKQTNCGTWHRVTSFSLIRIHSMQSWTSTTRHEVTRIRNTKRLRHTGKLFRNNLQLKDVC